MELLSIKKIGFESGSIFKLNWSDFEALAQIIVNHIIENKLHLKNVCLLGNARGALPLLTYVSHHTGIREISIIQLKRTKSDLPFDYGEVTILLKAIRNDFVNFIVLEDIVYKGHTIHQIQNELQKENKKIIEIYSLVIDEKYKNDIVKIKVKSASIIAENKWVKFPWEK